MLTPKIILYKHKTYADGSHPIILQVVKNGKAIRKVISKCMASDWLISKNRVSPRNIQAPRINNEIEIALRDYGVIKERNVFDFFDDHIRFLDSQKKISSRISYQFVRDQLFSFRPELGFHEINKVFIHAFSTHLLAGNKMNTVRFKMGVLKKLLKEAVKAELLQRNPLDEITFKKERTIKNKLTLEEIKVLIDAKLDGPISDARDIFLTSIYLRGTRIGDVLCLRPENISDKRIVFRERKTGRINNYELTEQLKCIFERHIGRSKHGYLFDYIDVPIKFLNDKEKVKDEIARCNSLIRFYLIKAASRLNIEKNLSMHIARHSFSKLASGTIKDTTITMGLVGHSSLAIHEGYISEISDDLVMDGYAKQVLDKLK